MKKLYIISGCNGAGKTTASFTVLPEMLKCREFVNADEIARGISPFQPEKVAIQAGRIMLSRVKELLSQNADFAFETTLASLSYAKLINEAQKNGYFTTLVFFWLNSPELAIERVKSRVKEGGHNVPEEVIHRRYHSGIRNLSSIYMSISDYWIIIDNSEPPFEIIAEGYKTDKIDIINPTTYNHIMKQ